MRLYKRPSMSAMTICQCFWLCKDRVRGEIGQRCTVLPSRRRVRRPTRSLLVWQADGRVLLDLAGWADGEDIEADSGISEQYCARVPDRLSHQLGSHFSWAIRLTVIENGRPPGPEAAYTVCECVILVPYTSNISIRPYGISVALPAPLMERYRR